jgi:choline dehydrogenase-like flavoprotein
MVVLVPADAGRLGWRGQERCPHRLLECGGGDAWLGTDGEQDVDHPTQSGQELLIDARSIDEGAELTCDLSVVGSGPAGISVVDRLRSSGVSICLLESGGCEPELRTQRLYRGENVGLPYFPLDSCRFRMFGGTSNRWGGWCRPLDPPDFEAPEGSAWAGWPITHAEVQPYYADAAELLQLPTHSFDVAEWSERLSPPLALTDENFEHVLVRYSPHTNFGRRYRQRIVDDRHVTTLLHANVTEMQLGPGPARVEALRVRTLTGRSFTVRSRAVVLAAGGIENPRLLLTSNSSRPPGLGNENDLVGRCFMEHIHAPAGHIRLNGHAEPPAFYRHASVDDDTVRGVIAPTGPGRRRNGLLACSFVIEPASYGMYGTPFLGWPALLTFPAAIALLQLRRRYPALAGRLKRRADRSWNAALESHTARAERSARGRAVAELEVDEAASDQLMSLYARAEQSPNLASRVTLADRRDALGVRLARLDWRLTEADTTSISSWLVKLDATLRRRSLGSVVQPEAGWETNIIGGPHHMGTTRMSAQPRHGVVDANCRVHSVDNLYVAGSSVFSTGGWANPTFTLVALSLRLADHLRGTLGG